MESDQDLADTVTQTTSPTKSSQTKTSPIKSSPTKKVTKKSPKKSPQKQDFQAASQAVELEYNAVKHLKRLSIGNSLSFDPDLPLNDPYFSNTSSNVHPTLDIHLKRSKSKLSKHSYQESDADADEHDLDDDSLDDASEILPHNQLSQNHNDEIEFDEEKVEFLDLDPDSSFGDDDEIWVPATAHPTISPENFKKHIQSQNRKLNQSSNSLRRGSSLKHLTKDLPAEPEKSSVESKEEAENRKPSLRELSAQLESLTKQAGLENDDAVTLARSLSKKSIGITRLEKEIYSRNEDETESDGNATEARYLSRSRNAFLRNNASKSRESLFIKDDEDEDETDNLVEMNDISADQSLPTTNFRKQQIQEPINKSTRDKLLMIKKNNLPSNHVYNDIRRIHNAQRPLGKPQLEPIKTMTPTSKLPALPPIPTSPILPKQTQEQKRQRHQQQYQQRTSPTTSVKQGFNEGQQHPQQRVPQRNSPHLQQQYIQNQQQQKHQHQHQQIPQRLPQNHIAHGQQGLAQHQQRRPQQQQKQHQYHQQYPQQHQLPPNGVVDQRYRQQQQQQQQQQQNQGQPPHHQQYSRQQYHQQNYLSGSRSNKQQPQAIPQKLPKQRLSAKARLDKSPISHSFPDNRTDQSLPYQLPNSVGGTLGASQHSRNRYPGDRNVLGAQNQLNLVEERRVVSDNVSHINRASPQDENIVTQIDQSNSDNKKVLDKLVFEIPDLDRSKQVEPEIESKSDHENEASFDDVKDENYQKEKKSKSSFTSFFKLKRDKPRSSSTSEEGKSAFKNLRSFSHTSESGSHSPKSDFKSFFSGKKEKEKKDKKLESESEGSESAKASTEIDILVSEKEATKNTEVKYTPKSSPKLGMGLFSLNKSSDNIVEKKEKRDTKKSAALNVLKTESSVKQENQEFEPISSAASDVTDVSNTNGLTNKSNSTAVTSVQTASSPSSPKQIASEQSSPISSDDQDSDGVVDRVEISIGPVIDITAKEAKNGTETQPLEVDESNEIIKRSLKETLEQTQKPTKPNQPLEMRDSAFGFPLPPVSHSTLVMLDHRFPVHVERAIYRLSHLKLADPKRALRQQVLLSNFMYSYLNLVNHTLWIQSKEQEETGLEAGNQQTINAVEIT